MRREALSDIVAIMPTIRLFAALIFLVACPGVTGAESKNKKRPRPAPVVSPILHDDGRVTFQIQAGSASEVSVSGEMMKGKLPLEKGENGIWKGTLEAVGPGLYGYNFTVDGVRMLDPGNPSLKPMRSPRTSILHLPGDHIFDFQDVPHGTVHAHAYQSGAIDRFREMKVYTPPGYEKGDTEYPLLVLQHGHSDSFATWVEYGKAHWIMDNLIAAGKATPMIVLMLDGHPIPESYGNGRSPENTEELRKDLLEAALPVVEKKYRILPGRDYRAIAGLSMGGLHALTIGLNELDTFSTIASFSGAMPGNGVLESALSDPDSTNQRLNLLWIACGKDDFLLEENEAFIRRLEKSGIEHAWLLTEGGHSWPVWRDYLAKLAPLLFRQAE